MILQMYYEKKYIIAILGVTVIGISLIIWATIGVIKHVGMISVDATQECDAVAMWGQPCVFFIECYVSFIDQNFTYLVQLCYYINNCTLPALPNTTRVWLNPDNEDICPKHFKNTGAYLVPYNYNPGFGMYECTTSKPVYQVLMITGIFCSFCSIMALILYLLSNRNKTNEEVEEEEDEEKEGKEEAPLLHIKN